MNTWKKPNELTATFMSEELNKIESLIERLRKYINNRIAQLKLTTAEKISKAAAVMIAIIMAAFFSVSAFAFFV